MTSPTQDPKLDAILEQLKENEVGLHWPARGTTRDELEAIIGPDYREIGASGKAYDREIVLKVLQERAQVPSPQAWTVSEFWCREVGPRTYLLTYALDQGDRFTRRMSIWRDTGEQWRCLFHQGTIAER